jgi:uncharacterized protein (TIGR02145 family)
VTFNVSWDKNTMPVELWSDTVWVFVDYNDAGVMKRLPVTDATASAGTVTKIPNNDKGVWVAGNARSAGSFSAKVELFTEIKDLAGACAYASNYPPVGKYTSVPNIAFTGTPEYDITIKKDIDGTTELRQSGSPFTVPASYTVESFTDKTGAPGIISAFYQSQGAGCTYTEPAVMGTFANFNPENVGAATYVSLTDERDSKNYPVLKMGERWVMARNLNYQKGLYHNTESDQANGVSFTSYDNGVPAIGSYWCPGTHSSTSSSSYSCEVYGALYTWETAMMLDGFGTWVEDIKTNTVASAGTYNQGRTAHNGAGAGGRGICPPNWHVPTDFEWGIFFDTVEGSGTGTVHQTAASSDWYGADAGRKSKAACTGTATDSAPLWTKNNGTDGEDTYEFRVLPTGARDYNGSRYINRGLAAWFWCSSAAAGTNTWHRVFDYTIAGVGHWLCPRSFGLSVRCIRD